ncbi:MULTISPECIES: NAD-dependent epimerase/dehydratase family protein [unclassified Leifsonia]|uniref:NAD-dependent epimerase/dehydratase family protein n=1 Tax=unclassified Leifsonia TaxID=2663824 RepID=UPI0006F76029|nr:MULTISPECIES: NAD-dependent epimerase/dehydratase family protein [unclassified Leifsonia]KQX08426.1 epimerase [Leifsonia sp. Root1293]KRA12710.1 epimerase [Leifsonia sp. Root60]
MSILLTGGAGYIGSAVLERLLAAGHEVSALVRSPEKAAVVQAAGATAVIGSADDAEIVRAAAGAADGVIHLASSPEVDSVLVPAVLAAIEGRDARFVHTGGIWIYGSGTDLTEQSPFQPLPISGWRAEGQALVNAAPNTAVVAPAVVYGDGAGIVRGLITAPRGTGVAPTVPLVGDGSQHWTTVHVDDIAALYVLAYENRSARGVYIGASGVNPTVRELGEAIAAAEHVAGGVAPETVEASRERLGADFADALLLDQQASGARARTELGWAPTGASVLDEIGSGSYAPSPAADRSEEPAA